MDAADQEALFTARWIVAEQLPAGPERDDLLDLLTEVLDVGMPTHVDGDLRPVEGAGPTEEATELQERDAGVPAESLRGRVAIAVGHNKGTGAMAHDGADEWTTRKQVAEALQRKLAKRGVEGRIFIRDRSLSYGEAMRQHGRAIDKFGADCALELHFNAAHPGAHGTEFIVVSPAGAQLARCLADVWPRHYPDMRLRHDRGVLLRKHGRGAGFCRAPECPAMVYEPCFATNVSDWSQFVDQAEKEAEAIADGLERYLETCVG